MTRLGIVVAENWDFFHEIYADLQAHYVTRLFQHERIRSGPFHERINKYLFQRRMTSLLSSSDVVLFEWASDLLVGAARLPKRSAMVVRLHRYELYEWAQYVNWDVLDRIILVSQAKQREFCALYPAQAQKTSVINPAIDLEKFALFNKPFAGNIGILCHLTPRKRVYDLILAFAEIADEDKRLHLHIGGGQVRGHADYFRSIHYLTGQLGLADRVTFYGNVSDAWNWYRKIDIFVSMSYSEGLQVTPMEAMACGCFTLAHQWEGAEELVPAANLFLSEHQLQQKLLDYCSLPEFAKQRQAEAMREWACERFDAKQAISQFRHTIDCAAQEWKQANR